MGLISTHLRDRGCSICSDGSSAPANLIEFLDVAEILLWLYSSPAFVERLLSLP